jgi:hypothetical protein
LTDRFEIDPIEGIDIAEVTDVSVSSSVITLGRLSPTATDSCPAGTSESESEDIAFKADPTS